MNEKKIPHHTPTPSQNPEKRIPLSDPRPKYDHNIPSVEPNWYPGPPAPIAPMAPAVPPATPKKNG